MHFLRWHYRNLLCAPAEWHSKWRHSKQLHSSGAAESHTDGTARYVFVCFVFFHQEWELRTNVQRAIEDPAGNFLQQNRRFQSKGRSKKDSQANEMILLLKPDSLRLGLLNPNLMEGKEKKNNFHKSSFVLTGALWHDPTPSQFKYNFKINKNDPWYQQV